MALLTAQDQEAVRARLSAMDGRVTLLFFTLTIGQTEASILARQILKEIAALSDRVIVEELNFILDKEQVAAFQIADVPAIAVLQDGNDTGIRFLGAPAGYEFAALLDAIALAGSRDSGLTNESKELIATRVTEPLDIQVFVTPTCPHCPRVVTLAHKMALENPLIRATCIEATEFLELSRKFSVNGVPKTVVNGTIEILGAVPEGTFVRTVLQDQGKVRNSVE